MRILITGGAGFVGSHIAEQLIELGHGVRIIDLLHPCAHRAAPEHLPSDAEFLHADIRDAAAMAGALRGVDAVCHQAAMVGLGLDIDDVADYVSHNALGTAVLLRELARQGFAGRVVQASSMVVYGEGRYRCATHGDVAPGPRSAGDLDAGRFEPPCPLCAAALEPAAVPESACPDPRNVYAATKLHQEHLATAFSRETGTPVTSLRYHNVYGPRMPHDTPYAGVASIFVSALAAGRPPQVFEDGGQLRDFVQVRDVARANVIALTADEAIPGAYNVASGTPRTIRQMAHALHRAAPNGAPAPEVCGRYRLGDVRHVFASTDLAAERLGFRAVEDFEHGMAELARPAGVRSPRGPAARGPSPRPPQA